MKAQPARIEKGMWWDRAWSLVEGCTPVSEGCAHCWSSAQTHMRARQKNEKIRARYQGLTDEKGRFNGKVRFMREALELPLKVKKPTVWAIWNDLFHEDVSFELIAAAFGVMAFCQHHTFIVLTKRSKRMPEFFNFHHGDYRSNLMWWMNEGCQHLPDLITNGIRLRPFPESLPLPNVIGMVTAENQPRSDERIPDLLASPFALRGVSLEPCLGDVNLSMLIEEGDAHEDGVIYINSLTGERWMRDGFEKELPSTEKLHLAILGGETGPGARPCHIVGIESVIAQCKAANVPCFVKQLGSYPVWAGALSQPIEPARGKCNNPDEWPENLRVREWPE